jgi:hypothetical protein
LIYILLNSFLPLINNSKKRWQIVGMIISGLLVVLILGVVLLLSRSEQIGKLAIQALNQQIEGEIQVDKAVITFWTYFPNAAIQLRQVNVTDPKGELLLRADKLSFRINPFNLLEGKIILNAFRLSNATIQVKHYLDGTWSHDILKKNTPSDQSNKIQFALTKGFLEYCALIYADELADHASEWYITKSNLDIKYQSDKLELGLVAHGVIDFLQLKDLNLTRDQSFKLALSLDAYLGKGIYQLKQSLIQMSGNQIALSGDIHFNEEQQYYNLQASCSQGKLQDFINLFPDKQLDFIRLFNPKGLVDFDLLYKGILRSDLQPELSGQLHIKEGSLWNSSYQTSVKQIDVEAKLQTSFLNTQIQYVLNGVVDDVHPFSSKGLLDLNEYSSYDIYCSGVLPAALLLKWSDMEGVESAEGNIYFTDVHLINGPKYSSSFTGHIKMNELKAVVQKEPLLLAAFETRITDQGLAIDTFSLTGLGSFLSGKCMLQGYQLLSPSAQRVSIHGTLYGKQLYWNQWKAFLDQVLPQDSLQEEKPFFHILLEQDVTFQAKLEGFRWDDLIFDRVEGHFIADQGNLQSECTITAFGGNLDIDGNGKVHAKGMDIQVFGSASGVDINQLMVQSHNLGQDFLLARHIRGQLTTKVIAEMNWDNDGSFKEQELNVVSAARIDQGELIRFPLLEDFSTFVKVEDLRHVRFTSLHNLFEIRKGTVTIPEIFIQSNAVNLNLAGTHTFQQQMDYGIMVNAGQVLSNKFKKHNPTLRPIQARRKGFVNLYYRVSGFPDNMVVLMDRPGYDRVHENTGIRRDVIRQKLMDHFGPSDLFDTAIDRAPDFFDDKVAAPLEYVQFSN